MSPTEDLPDALIGDEKRQAVDSLRGYLYQIWHSVAAWIDLGEDEALYLEGAEDFDVVSKQIASTNQIKDTAKSGNITLRSKDVLEAINHYWEHRISNKSVKVFFRFLTTARPGIEQGKPFGNGISGIALWNKLRDEKSDEGIKLIVNFLANEPETSTNVKHFLEKASVSDVKDNLIDRIVWDVGNPGIPYIENLIRDKLIVHGEKFGVSPAESAKVVDHLLKEAFDVAVQPENRMLKRARFLVIFEEKTSVRVPLPQLLALTRLAGQEQALIIQQTDPFAVPALSFRMLQRSLVVDEISKKLAQHRVVILNGSTGMGKSTLAKLATANFSGTWLWADLRSRESGRLAQTLHAASLAIHRSSDVCNVVLDDVTLNDDGGQRDNQLSAFLYAVMQQGGKVIITSQGNIPSKVTLQLSLSREVYFQVPPLSVVEIESFAKASGCISETDERSWAKSIFLQTNGHPHLVHAYISSLATRGWPAYGVDNLLEHPPEEVEQVRTEARQLLQQLPSRESRELLNRLSIVHQPFRRDHAVKLAETEPAIEDFIGSFDRLVGPWIEHLERTYYRLSPLLDQLATQSWSVEKLQTWHRKIVHVIDSCGSFSTHEISALLLHGLCGKAEKNLASLAIGLLLNSDFPDIHIADALSWFTEIAAEHPQRLYDENHSLSLLLRQLQFKLSLFSDEISARKIAKAWDYEASKPETQPHDKAIFIFRVITAHQFYYNPRRLVEVLAEVAVADTEQPFLSKLMPGTADLREWMLSADGSYDPIQTLFRFIPGRYRKPSDVLTLLEALDSTPDSVRRRMLQLFKTFSGEARLFVDRIWMYEADQKEPNWQKCLRHLERVLDYASRWNAIELAAAAYRGTAIVYHEYLHEPDTAMAVLTAAQQQLGIVNDLEDKRADVFMEGKQYRQAYDIWQSILPQWTPPSHHGDTAPLYACRQAAMAAFYLGDREQAAQLMFAGYERAERLGRRQLLAVGFLADYAFVKWIASGIHSSFVSLVKMVELLQELPDPLSDATSYTLHRRAGKLLLWVEHQVTNKISAVSVPEPIVGACSNPGKEAGFSVKDPLAPIDYSWMMLINIEVTARLGDRIFLSHYHRLTKSDDMIVRFQLHTSAIRHSLQKRDLLALTNETIFVDIEQRRLKKIKDDGNFKIPASHPLLQLFEEPSPEHIEFVCLTLLCGLIRQQATKGLLSSLDCIDDALRPHPAYQVVRRWVSFVKHSIAQPARVKLGQLNSKTTATSDRIALAFLLSTEPNLDIDALFFSQCVLISNCLESPWLKEIADDVAEILRERWQAVIQEPALLRSPRSTVPAIWDACRSSLQGVQKIAVIVLAVSNASSLSLPDSFLNQMRQLLETSSKSQAEA